MASDEVRTKITKLLEKFTTANQPDPVYLKQLKSICKKDERNVGVAYEVLLTQLRKHHTVIRFHCLEVIDQLFQRSHCFRTLLLGDFHQFSVLTLGHEANQPLPPPESYHKKLREESIRKLKEWRRKFQSGYKKLELSFNVLKDHVDFEENCLINDCDRKRKLEREEKLNNIWRERVRKVGGEFGEYSSEISSWCERTENLFRILSDGNNLENYEEEVQGQYNILQKRLLPKVEAWTVTLTKAGNLTDANLLRLSVDLKKKLTESRTKLETFNINLNKESSSVQETREDKKSNSCVDLDPTSWEATLHKVTGEKTDLNLQLEHKPDLTDGGETGCSSRIPRLEDVQFPDQMIVDPDKSRFWVSDGREGEIVSVGRLQRVSQFVSPPEPQPVVRQCGVELPSGKLCPRRDKVKCPLHGAILPDNEGSSRKKLTPAEKKKSRKSTKLKSAKNYDESSKSRIEKKIFDRSSAKRVAKDLQRYDKIRTKNKFTDQFNY